MIPGYLDAFIGREIHGWARSSGNEGPPTVEFVIDGEIAGRACANQYRSDLVEIGVDQGLAGFCFVVPERYCDGLPHEVDVRLSGSSKPLGRSPQVFAFGQEREEKRAWCEKVLALSGVDRPAFVASLAKTRKLAIFATYHRHCSHLTYHHRTIASLTKAGFTVLNVHATDDPAGRIRTIDAEDCFTLVRRNIGYDFGSYATGLLMFSEHVHDLDELVLINDSVVQIAADLHPTLQRFRLADGDVVSCTDSFETQHHLQSYCLWFGAKALASRALLDFMTNYSFTSVKEEVIEEGEIGLSKAMRSAGLRLASLYDYGAVAAYWLDDYEQHVRFILDLPGGSVGGAKSAFKTSRLEQLDHISSNILSGIPTNPSHFFWDTLIDYFDFPFIKRELIVANPALVPTYAKIATYLSDGDVRASVSEMIRIYGGSLVPAMISGRSGRNVDVRAIERQANAFSEGPATTRDILLSARRERASVSAG